MRQGIIILGILFGIALSNVSHAQQTADSDDTLPTVVQNKMGVGDINRPTASALSGIQFSASNNSNQAALNLAGSILTGTNWSVIASSPITMGSTTNGGNSATNANIATLDGLANGFSLKAQISQFKMFNLSTGNADTDKIVATAMAACVKKGGTDCNTLAPGALIDKYDTDEMSAYLEAHFSYALTYGLQLGAGYNQFTFYNSSTLAKLSQDDAPWSARAFVGIMPRAAVPAIVTLAANYQQAFTASPTSTKCLASASSLKCQTGAIGAPTRADKMLLSLDLHSQFSLFGHSVGLV